MKTLLSCILLFALILLLVISVNVIILGVGERVIKYMTKKEIENDDIRLTDTVN